MAKKRISITKNSRISGQWIVDVHNGLDWYYGWGGHISYFNSWQSAWKSVFGVWPYAS